MNINKIPSEADALSSELVTLTLLPELAGQQLGEQTAKIIESLQSKEKAFYNFLRLNVHPVDPVSKAKISKKIKDSTKFLDGRSRLSSKYAVPPSIDAVEKSLGELTSALVAVASQNEIMLSSSNGEERVSSKLKSRSDIEKQLAEAIPDLLSSVKTAKESVAAVQDDLSKFQKRHNVVMTGSSKIKKDNDAINSASQSIAEIKALVDKIDKKAFRWKLQMNKNSEISKKLPSSTEGGLVLPPPLQDSMRRLESLSVTKKPIIQPQKAVKRWQ